MRRSAPKHLSSAVASVIRDLGLGPKIRQFQAVDLWPAVVGDKIASVAKAERIEGGKLIVRVSRSTWRNELVFLRRELIARMNKAMHQEIIKDIIFR